MAYPQGQFTKVVLHIQSRNIYDNPYEIQQVLQNLITLIGGKYFKIIDRE